MSVLLLLLAALSVGFAWADYVSGYLSYAAALTLASIWLLRRVLQTRPIRWHWAATVLVLAAAWGILQCLAGISVYAFVSVRESVCWLAAAAVFVLAVNCISSPQQIDLLSRRAIWFGGILSLLTVLCWYTAGNTILWVIPTKYAAENAGTFLNRDQYAAFIELLLPIALARSMQAARLNAPCYFAAAAMYGSVFVTASRAGTILVTVELLIFLAIACRRVERGYLAAIMVGGCALAVTALFGPEYVFHRFQADDLFTFRREMLISTWEMMKAKWLTGFGMGTWPTVYPAFAVFDPPGFFMNHAHNDWAEWTADGGILFTANIAAVALAAALAIRRNLWSMGVASVFLHAFVDFPLHKPAIVLCTFIILGAALGGQRGASAPSNTFLR
jgi:O-antigen ligase